MFARLRRLFARGPEEPFRRMVLRRVVYELFDWEAEGAEDVPPGRWYDELQRQVRLEPDEGACVYVSWSWGQGMPDYFLSCNESSFCTGLAEAERDVSGAPPWQALIGKMVTVAYRDRTWQVIEVRSEDAVVYCCSFQSDRVYVMSQLRAPD